MDSDPTTRAADAIIAAALAEDLGEGGDLTVQCLVPAGARLAVELIAKEEGLVCGAGLFARVCAALGSGAVQVEAVLADGSQVQAGTPVLRAEGPAAVLLIAERTALNLMQRLSGVATTTARHVAAVAGTAARVFDTRKTTPGLRLLEKAAVRAGGGCNHRIGLWDQVLIKENHIALMGAAGPAEAVRRCRERLGGSAVIEVEIETLTDLPGVIAAGASIVLCDNMAPQLLREAVAMRGSAPVQLEASGGITLQNIRPYAETGIERISVGALTHSVAALDLSLRYR